MRLQDSPWNGSSPAGSSTPSCCCARPTSRLVHARSAWTGRRRRSAPLAGPPSRITESPGDPTLRPPSRGCMKRVSADEVLVFSGAEESDLRSANVLLGAGDHAIVVRPAYQSLAEVARAAGADVTRVDLREANGWRLDTDEVRAALRPTTR